MTLYLHGFYFVLIFILLIRSYKLYCNAKKRTHNSSIFYKFFFSDPGNPDLLCQTCSARFYTSVGVLYFTF